MECQKLLFIMFCSLSLKDFNFSIHMTSFFWQMVWMAKPWANPDYSIDKYWDNIQCFALCHPECILDIFKHIWQENHHVWLGHEWNHACPLGNGTEDTAMESHCCKNRANQTAVHIIHESCSKWTIFWIFIALPIVVGGQPFCVVNRVVSHKSV